MAKQNDLIPIEQFNESGLAPSKWSGLKNSFYRMVGLDPHSLPGVLGVEQKLSKTSSTTVTELCREAVNCSNGSAFFFSYESGKIWEVQSDGTTRLVHTTTPSAGEAKCLGAVEYQGKIIWATENKLHYITVANSGLNNWAVNAVEDWQTFGVGNKKFHPMLNHTPTLYLFIGDGNQVAQYDGVTDIFSANALDIRTPLIVKSLGEIATDLLIGTYIADTVVGVEILRWNTWDDSFTSSDKIPEIGINAFLQADNMVLVQAGNKGNIYWYDGTNLELFMKIPGEYSDTATCEVYPSSVASKEGQILFGVSNITGNPCPQMIYRIARHSRDYNWIMDQPFPISERVSDEMVTSGLSIGAILVQSAYLLCSWKSATSVGIDRTDNSHKLDGAYFETRVMVVNREEEVNFSEIFFAYASLPDDTDINFYIDKNYAGYDSVLSKVDDTQRKIVRTKDESTIFSTLQLKTVLTAYGNTAPKIEAGAVRIR